MDVAHIHMVYVVEMGLVFLMGEDVEQEIISFSNIFELIICILVKINDEIFSFFFKVLFIIYF